MTIEQLRACWWQRSRIESIKGRIRRIEEQITSASARPLSHAPKGGAGNRDAIGEAVVRMESLKERLLAEVLKLEESLSEVEQWLDTLPPNQAAVMRARYVDGMSWRTVARKLHYSEGHCRNVNNGIVAMLRNSHDTK